MSDNRDVQGAADQEIPDRRTAQAAQWLSENAATLSTPEFWMIAGLLGMYGEKIASQVREQSIAELVGEWVSVASPDAPESLPPIAHKVAAKLLKQVELGGKHVKSIVAAYLVAYAEQWHPKERKTQ